MITKRRKLKLNTTFFQKMSIVTRPPRIVNQTFPKRIAISVHTVNRFLLSSQITIVLMHVPFRIHYRNNLIDKKDSYPIPRTPSWDDRNCSYGHQLYPSVSSKFILHVLDTCFSLEMSYYIIKRQIYVKKKQSFGYYH